jgi:hypothetical protein
MNPNIGRLLAGQQADNVPLHGAPEIPRPGPGHRSAPQAIEGITAQQATHGRGGKVQATIQKMTVHAERVRIRRFGVSEVIESKRSWGGRCSTMPSDQARNTKGTKARCAAAVRGYGRNTSRKSHQANLLAAEQMSKGPVKHGRADGGPKATLQGRSAATVGIAGSWRPASGGVR